MKVSLKFVFKVIIWVKGGIILDILKYKIYLVDSNFKNKFVIILINGEKFRIFFIIRYCLGEVCFRLD